MFFGLSAKFAAQCIGQIVISYIISVFLDVIKKFGLLALFCFQWLSGIVFCDLVLCFECRFFFYMVLMFFTQILHMGSINVVFGLSAKFAVQSIVQIVISCNVSLFSNLT